jgi:HEAT repeat protein
VEAKGRILHAMGVAGATDQLQQAAKGEQNPEVRRKAIHALGVFGGRTAGKTLMEMYNQEKQPETKKAILQALFVNDDADGLVALAKQEQDPQMRKEIVHKLSLMDDKVAIDYMMDILNK